MDGALVEAEASVATLQAAFDLLSVSLARARVAVADLRREHAAGSDSWDRVPLLGHSDPPGGHHRRWYAVITPLPAQGIYVDYGAYADAVREPGAAWSGRGSIPFARGSRSQAFNSRAEALDFYVSQTQEVPKYRY